MSDTASKVVVDLNLAELTSLAARLLDGMFFATPKNEAKAVFKDLKKGLTILMGTVTLQQQYTFELKLALDYSEFKGPGFNYDLFLAALQAVMKQIKRAFDTRAELNVMTSEAGSALVHLPGAVVFENQLNVMVMAFEFVGERSITIKLMYLEPDQYEPYRQQK